MNTKDTCKLCKSDKKVVFQELKGYIYYTCQKCKAIYSVKTAGHKERTETYLDDPIEYLKIINPEGQLWMLDEFEKMYFNIAKAKDRGKLLEIGAGVGYWDILALGRGWKVSGIETSKKSAEFAQLVFKIPVDNCFLQSYRPKEKFDAIAMIEVIEHIDDPLWVIEKLKSIAPKGVLFGTTPNTESDYWKTSEQNIYVPDDHVFLFSKKTIEFLAKKTKLRKLKIEYFGMGENHDSNLMFSARL